MQRRGSRPSALFLVCAAWLLLLAGRARAAEPVPLRVEYSATPGCPPADRFLAEVTARTSLSRPARPDERATALTITIQEVSGGSKGILRLESPDGATSSRHVSAADCGQVVSALALMTALAIDPDASTAPARPAPPPPPPTPPPVRAPPAARQAPATSRGKWRFGVGAGLEALSGVAPELVLFVRPSVEVSHVGASSWSSAFRLSAGFGRGAVRQAEGGAEFTLLAGRLEGCPARLSATRTLRISPCLALDAGRLTASGTFVAPAEHVDRPWVATGAVGRLEWEVLPVLILEIAGEVLFPLERDRFFVASDTTLHRTPVAAGGFGGGLVVLFP